MKAIDFPQDDAKLLKRALLQESFRIVIIEHQNYGLIAQTKEYLQLAYPTRKIKTLPTKTLNYESLMQSICNFEKGILLIEDTEEILAREEVYIGLNQRRDKLAGFDIALVFFVMAGKLPDFAKKMPDLFSRISITFNWEQWILKNETKFIFEDNFSTSFQTNKNFEERKQILKQLKTEIDQTNPEEIEVLYALYQIYINMCEELRLHTEGIKAVETLYQIIKEQNNDEQNLEKLAELNNTWAIFAENLGDYELGKSKQLEAITQANLLDSKILLAKYQNNLGMTYLLQKKFSQAEHLFKSSLEITKQNLGDSSNDYFMILNSMANLYIDQKKYEQAEEIYKKMINKVLEIMGKSNYIYTNCLDNLSIIYMKQGRYHLAEDILKEILEIQEPIFGEYHVDYARTLKHLAVVYSNSQKNEVVEETFMKALGIYKEVLGIESREYMNCLRDLASTLFNMKKYTKSKDTFEQVRKIYKKLFGENSPQYIEVSGELAQTYIKIHQYKEAKVLLEKTYKMAKEVFGEDDGYTQAIKVSLSEAIHLLRTYKH